MPNDFAPALHLGLIGKNCLLRSFGLPQHTKQSLGCLEKPSAFLLRIIDERTLLSAAAALQGEVDNGSHVFVPFAATKPKRSRLSGRGNLHLFA
ncbi:hypothetical protein CN09_00540 [Rhizobium rhizogenes]|nr:hypothetical protein CN09_00540 [Rhizobium rhizogenes]